MTEFRLVVKIFIVLLFLLSINKIWGQDNRPMRSSNLHFGGGIGLSFGNGFFSGSLSPSAIYQFDEQFALGVGLNAAYSSFNNRYTSTIVGGSIIGLYNVIPQIQLSTEFEELNVARKYEFDGANFSENYWYPALFVGVGFRNGNFTMGIKYDVLFDREKSIYADAYIPFVRVYF